MEKEVVVVDVNIQSTRETGEEPNEVEWIEFTDGESLKLKVGQYAFPDYYRQGVILGQYQDQLVRNWRGMEISRPHYRIVAWYPFHRIKCMWYK